MAVISWLGGVEHWGEKSWPIIREQEIGNYEENGVLCLDVSWWDLVGIIKGIEVGDFVWSKEELSTDLELVKNPLEKRKSISLKITSYATYIFPEECK